MHDRPPQIDVRLPGFLLNAMRVRMALLCVTLRVLFSPEQGQNQCNCLVAAIISRVERLEYT